MDRVDILARVAECCSPEVKEYLTKDVTDSFSVWLSQEILYLSVLYKDNPRSMIAVLRTFLMSIIDESTELRNKLSELNFD